MQFRLGTFTGLPSDNWRYVGGDTNSIKQNGRVTQVERWMEFEFAIHFDDRPGIDVITRQRALNDRFREIQAATYRPPGFFDVGFVLDDLTPSRAWIDASDTTSGVYIDTYPFPQPDIEGGDFATSLSGRLRVSAIYEAAQFTGAGGGGNDPLPLADFEDSITTVGNGGPRTAILEYTTGLPDKFVIADKTKCTASQSGRATVHSKVKFYPAPEPPFFDRQHLINESEALTKHYAQLGENLFAYTIAWNYQYEAIGPLQIG